MKGLRVYWLAVLMMCVFLVAGCGGSGGSASSSPTTGTSSGNPTTQTTNLSGTLTNWMGSSTANPLRIKLVKNPDGSWMVNDEKNGSNYDFHDAKYNGSSAGFTSVSMTPTTLSLFSATYNFRLNGTGSNGTYTGTYTDGGIPEWPTVSTGAFTVSVQ